MKKVCTCDESCAPEKHYPVSNFHRELAAARCTAFADRTVRQKTADYLKHETHASASPVMMRRGAAKKNRKQRKAAATRRVRKRAMSGGPKIVRTKTTNHLHRPRHYETKTPQRLGFWSAAMLTHRRVICLSNMSIQRAGRALTGCACLET